MNRFKKISLKILYPHPFIVFILIIISVAGLIYVFTNNAEQNAIAYFVYVTSFYTLCVSVAGSLPFIKQTKKALHSNTHTSKYMTEAELRARVSIYIGTVINISFAIFKLTAGIYYNSVWFIAVGFYYSLLSVIRFILINRYKKTSQHSGKATIYQWKSYRLCGELLFLLNLAISGLVIQMIWQNKSFSYPGFVIYATAAYTFYRLTTTIIKLVRKKQHNPVLLAAKAVDLSISIMSLFSLQTAMFASFGAGTPEKTIGVMNLITGLTVCLSVVCIAVFMIKKSIQKIKSISEDLYGKQ